jgi:hypothetical protein
MLPQVRRATRRQSGLGRLLFLLVVVVGTSAGQRADAADVWINVAVPAAVHLGAPSDSFEWGLRTDALWLTSIGVRRSARLDIGAGPYLEGRILGLSSLGVGGGIEFGAFSGGHASLGMILRAGVSRWVTSGQDLGTIVNGSLGSQLRFIVRQGRVSWTPSVGLFVSAGRSVNVDRWELTAGIELGGALLSLLASFFAFGNHD